MMLPCTLTLKWEPYPGDLTLHEPSKRRVFLQQEEEAREVDDSWLKESKDACYELLLQRQSI